jgi:SAM-dependent methyltransferase
MSVETYYGGELVAPSEQFFTPGSSLAYDYQYPAKDYAGEAAFLTGTIDRYVPESPEAPRTYLDVGCGTGRHLAEFRKEGFKVEGLDISKPHLERARARLGPDVPLTEGNMEDFDLGKKFDVVSALFAVAGQADGKKGLLNMYKSMARHVKPGGLILVEPWLYAEEYDFAGAVRARSETDEATGIVVQRITVAEQAAPTTVDIRMHVTVAVPGTPDKPTEVHIVPPEVHHFGLHSRAAYAGLLRTAMQKEAQGDVEPVLSYVQPPANLEAVREILVAHMPEAA